MKRPLSFVAATVFTATSSTTALADIAPVVLAGPVEETGAVHADMSGDELQRFSRVRDRVTAIQREFVTQARRLRGHPELTASLERRAQRRIRNAIEDAGLAVARYHQLRLLASYDDDIRRQVGGRT